jgi:hypothetical protein
MGFVMPLQQINCDLRHGLQAPSKQLQCPYPQDHYPRFALFPIVQFAPVQPCLSKWHKCHLLRSIIFTTPLEWEVALPRAGIMVYVPAVL